jgi:hypothetical protein
LTRVRKYHLLAAALAAGLLLCSSFSYSAEPPSLDTILAALRQQGLATVEVTYTITTPASSQLKLAAPYGGGAPAAIGGPTQEGSGDQTYIRTSEALFMGNYGREVSVERVGFCGLSNMRGKPTTTSNSPTGTIVNQQRSILSFWAADVDRIETVLRPMLPWPDDTETWTLYGWVKYGKLQSKMEPIDGHDCWKVEVQSPEGVPLKLLEAWLDPTIGYNPRRLIMHFKGSAEEHATMVSYKDYREIADGIWFPAEELVGSPDPNAAPSITCRASEVRGDRKLSKDDIAVKFPSRTEITTKNADGTIEKSVQP